MKAFRFLSTLIICLVIVKPASAIDWGITEVRANNEYSRGSVWSGLFNSYNGTSYDVSNFYKSKNVILTFHQTLYVDLEDTVFFLPMYFDNGYESDLLTTEPVLAFGLGIQKKLGNLTMELAGKNLWQIGGSTSEQPCFDSFSRQYHCGTGMAWSDSSSVHLIHDLEPKFNFVLRYAF